MNEFNVFTKHVLGGYHGYLRTPSDGQAKPILGKGGKPEVYESELAALRSVTGHLVRYINGHLYRSGEVASGAVLTADSYFKPGVRQKGRARTVIVERKGRRK